MGQEMPHNLVNDRQLPSRATLRDVAALAGVSVGTVSNTLNRPHAVRKLTRDAVEKAIAELGFIPSQAARVLTGAASQVIGLVIPEIVSPFFMEIAHAVERVATRANHVVILSSSDSDAAKETRLLDMLAAQDVRGAILTPAAAGRRRPKAPEQSRTPLVYVDYKMPRSECSVSVDHVAGARMATEHLLQLGHRKLAFVGNSAAVHQFRDRAKGTREAILQEGLNPQECLIEVTVPAISLQDGMAAGEQLAQGMLPTGILCGNDMMAFGVYKALTAAGIRVPDDVSLVGYDDIQFAQDWIVPLTSVRQPTSQMGKIAAELLFAHTAGDGDHRHQQVILQPELIVRASSGPVADGPQ